MNVTRSLRRLLLSSNRWRLPSERTLGLVVIVLLSTSALALVVHDPRDPRPAASPAPVEEGLAARALDELAASGAIPGPPATTVPPEKAGPPAKVETTTAPEPKPAPSGDPAPAGAAAGIAAYRGMGTWVDVYDWSATFTKGRPQVAPDAVDRMADLGVQTLYIQASKHDAPTTVLEPELLRAWIDRARDRGIRVVAWYLPTLVDPARDLERMTAIAALPVDSVAVDIESKDVGDLAERNRRLVNFSAVLRQSLPGRTIGGIVLPPVVLEAVNPLYWPSFPYQQIAPYYDVWMTMGYWTNRISASTYRDANRYTKENVTRLRANLGLPDALVHPIGGIGDRTTAVDLAGYKAAVTETGSIGGSLYDWRTTRAEQWEGLQAFRR
ncbi:MAG: hypothetical protein M3378_08300 [Actinomycetota bacterium]|nr:hypothetical protein [Actinomycetota bacterium]